MVTTFYPPWNFGGDGLFIQRLSRDLVAAGHQVEVVHCRDAWRVTAGRDAPEPDPDTVAAGADDGVVVHTLRSRLGLLSPLLTQQLGRPALKHAELARLLDRDFDVINFHNISLIGGPGVLTLGRATKLYSLHEHWWVCPTHILWKYTDELCTRPACLRCSLAHRTPPQLWRRMRGWMARCLAEVDLLLAPCAFTADRHRDWLERLGREQSIEILPEYSPPLAVERQPSVPLPERYFLYVGRLTRPKGVYRLLEAFARRPDLPLVVAGTGAAEEDLRRLATPNVQLLGHVPREELGGIYARAAALVVPSVCAETFGLIASEALSCSVPVISSRSGGPEDIVTPEVGFLYDTEREMLEQVDRLWADAELGRRMGAAGRARYETLYTPEAYLERYMDAVRRASLASATHQT